jgi:hypothetical protein
LESAARAATRGRANKGRIGKNRDSKNRRNVGKKGWVDRKPGAEPQDEDMCVVKKALPIPRLRHPAPPGRKAEGRIGSAMGRRPAPTGDRFRAVAGSDARMIGPGLMEREPTQEGVRAATRATLSRGPLNRDRHVCRDETKTGTAFGSLDASNPDASNRDASSPSPSNRDPAKTEPLGPRSPTVETIAAVARVQRADQEHNAPVARVGEPKDRDQAARRGGQKVQGADRHQDADPPIGRVGIAENADRPPRALVSEDFISVPAIP